MAGQRRSSFERLAVAGVMTAIVAPIIAVAGAGFGVPLRVGVLVALALGAISCRWTARLLPHEWDGLYRKHRGWSVLWLIVGLAAVARTAGVCWFMADATHAQASVYWFDHFYTAHSCYSQYWRAAELARAGAQNLYDTAHYNGWIGRFQVDEFLYVPQFLILPRLGLALGGDFYQIRAVWFAIEASLLAVAMLALCSWIGGPAGRRLALLLPALWVSSPILATLQVGNYQLAAIALSLLAMLLFERRRPELGGALLALAAFKLWPGVLVLYLAASKRWRAVAWTAAFSLLYCVVAYLWMGGQPFVAFLHYDWPRLVSRDAWPYLDDLDVSGINDSVPGLVLKLKLLGVKGMSHSLEDMVEHVWTLVVLGAAVVTARRSPHLSRLQRAGCWLALLALASFRAPFVPDIYGLITPLLLWSLVAASVQLSARNALWLVMLWLAVSAVLPFSGTPLAGYSRLAVSTASQLIAIGLCFWVMLRDVWQFRETKEALVVIHENDFVYGD